MKNYKVGIFVFKTQDELQDGLYAYSQNWWETPEASILIKVEGDHVVFCECDYIDNIGFNKSIEAIDYSNSGYSMRMYSVEVYRDINPLYSERAILISDDELNQLIKESINNS